MAPSSTITCPSFSSVSTVVLLVESSISTLAGFGATVSGREEDSTIVESPNLQDWQHAVWLLLFSVVEMHGRLVRIQLVRLYLKVVNTLLLLGTWSQPDLLALWLWVSWPRCCWHWRLYIIIFGWIRKWWLVANDNIVNYDLSNDLCLLIVAPYHLVHNFICNILFRKSSQNHGLWNVDASSSLEGRTAAFTFFSCAALFFGMLGMGLYSVATTLNMKLQWKCNPSCDVLWDVGLLDAS